MRKQPIVKTDVAGVFPFIGSPEEGKNKKIRTLKLVGFRLTPLQAIDAATALLTQAKAAQNGDKHSVLDVLARRKEGASVLTVQTAIAPPERKKKAKTSGANGHAQAASSSEKKQPEGDSTPKQRKPRVRKPKVTPEGTTASVAA